MPPLIPLVTYSNTTAWETAVIQAWADEPDCNNPTSGNMCDACGIGAAIVEMNAATGGGVTTTVRSIMTGPGELPSPHDYVHQTFEIASYSKHFTALAMVFLENQYSETHSVDITPFVPLADTAIGQWIPCDWDNADYSHTRSITLEELRLHTSGLPPQAPNHDAAPRHDGNPFGGYSHDLLCESLLKLTALPSRGRFLYSNYAYGLLGYALQYVSQAIHQKKNNNNNNSNNNVDVPLPSYQAVVQEAVLTPFHMNTTKVELTEAEWQQAAPGCDRGGRSNNHRHQYAMRRGAYGVLQGNGALRSTLPDMASFLMVTLLIEAGLVEQHQGRLTAAQAACYAAVKTLQRHYEDACTCVSGWCEGNLCTLPNPVQEQITDSGVTIYTSGGLPGKRKSGDTEGYSVRGAWSLAKGKNGRAVFVVDTCGGCGERGTSGSAAQRAALLLADGPPAACLEEENENENKNENDDEKTTTLEKDDPGQCNDSDDNNHKLLLEQIPKLMVFAGKAESHVFPSVAYIEVMAKTNAQGQTTLSVASSDGAGCSAPARPILEPDEATTGSNKNEQQQHQTFRGWEYDTSILYGCGFGGDDPLAKIPQKRSLRFLRHDYKNKHATAMNELDEIHRALAVLQEMGQDIHLTLKKMDLGIGSVVN